MPEEKRTYEISIHRVQTLKRQQRQQLSAHPAKDAAARGDIFPTTQRAAPGISGGNDLDGFAIPRDIIMRLIDWLKED